MKTTNKQTWGLDSKKRRKTNKEVKAKSYVFFLMETWDFSPIKVFVMVDFAEAGL